MRSRAKALTVALPEDLILELREAVDCNDYGSMSELVREALRDWKVWRRGAAPASRVPRVPRSGTTEAENICDLTPGHRMDIDFICRRLGVKRLLLLGSVKKRRLEGAVEFCEPREDERERLEELAGDLWFRLDARFDLGRVADRCASPRPWQTAFDLDAPFD